MRELFRFLWPFCRKNKKYFYILTIFVFIGVLLEIPYPLFLKYFIDVIIKDKNLYYLKIFTLILVSLLLLKFIIDSLRNYFSYVFKEKTFIKLQTYIFEETLRVKYEFFEKNNTGYIVSRIHNEVVTLQRFFWDFFIKLATDFLMFSIGLYFIFRFSVKLSIISLLLLPFFIFIYKFFSKKIEESSKNFQESYSQLYGFFYETIQMIFLIKTLLLRNFTNKKLSKILSSYYIVKKKNVIINTMFTTSVMLIGGLSPIIILFLGGKEVIKGNLSLGTLIAFNSFLEYIFGPTKNILNYGSDIATALASFKRIKYILNLEKEKIAGKELKYIDSIVFKNVSFAYDSKKVLTDLNFKINKGDKIGILGKIGSGKTTMIKLLIGLYGNYKGEILVNGKSMRDIKNITEKIGIIPQDNFLFSDTIFNNIKIGNLNKKDEEVFTLIEKMKFHDMIRKKDNGIYYKLNSNGSGLSGGERQKIVAARVAYRNPELIIIDEGTSNLDAESEYFVYNNLFEFFNKKIIIIISHRFYNIMKCDKIIYMKEGKIINIGSHDELYNKYPEYKELYIKQNENERNKNISEVKI